MQSKAERDASHHSYTLTVQMAQLSLDTNVIYLSLYKSTQDVWPSTKNYKHTRKMKSFSRDKEMTQMLEVLDRELQLLFNNKL